MSTDTEIAFLKSALGVSTGTLTELRRAYYAGMGSTVDRERAFLLSKGATGTSLQDLRFSYYKSVGSGNGSSLSDYQAKWFSNPTPVAQTLGTENYSTNWTQWTTFTGTGTTAASGNVGTLVPTATNYQTFRKGLTAIGPQTDMEVYVEISWPVLQEQYIDIGVRVQNTATTNPKGYYISLAPTGTTYSLLSSDGQFTALEQKQPLTYTANAWYGVKLRVRGQRISTKVWNLSGSEPFGYQLWNLDTPYSSGYVTIGASSGASTNANVKFRNLSVVTTVDQPGDTTPTSTAMPTASSVVSSNHTWSLSYSNDFLTNATEGTIRTAYPAMGYATEEEGDTASGVTGGKKSANKTVSVSNSVMDIHQRVIGGTPYGAFVMPDNYAGHLYGRVSIRFKAVDTGGLGGFKFVNLWWPSTNVWDDGEIDWPESDNGLVPRPASASVNPAVYTNGGQSRVFYPSSVVAADANTTDWHVATTDWAPDGISYYLDGKIVARIANPAGIPNKAMRVTLQAETWIAEGTVPAAADGHVYIDWVAIYDMTA